MMLFRTLLAGALLALSACNSAPANGPVVLAASSMQEALTEAAASWAEQGHPAPVLSFAASSAIARQVDGGAPADLVITADGEWMDWLGARALIAADTRRNIAGNMLVLVAPRRDPQPTFSSAGEALAALDGRLAMGEPDSVPAGKYGKQALTALGLWDTLAPRMVPAENVRAALALVESGEAELGIVYASDAQASTKVAVAARFAPDAHSPIVYPAALIEGSEQPDARAFLDFLASAPGQAILRAHGFSRRAVSWPLLSAAEWAVIGLSLKVSLLAVAASLPVAYTLAWLIARRRFPGRMLLDALIHLPLVLPPVVTGWLLLLAFGRNGPVGGWLFETFGVTLVFQWTGAALAAAVMALPLMVRAMRLSIEAVDRRLVGAARTLGASRWHAFVSITLPLSLPGIMAGGMLGFARSLGEFGATITFAANIEGQTRTLPLAIYSGLQVPGGEGAVARLAVISIVLSLGALLVSEVLVRRSAGGRAHVL